MYCCNDAHRRLLALTDLLNQLGVFGVVMPYRNPLFNLGISCDWHKVFWRMLLTYVQQFSIWKINVLHWKDRGNLLWGKCSTWLVVSRRWIILSILGSTCYHDRMQLSPFTRHITSTSQGCSSITEHCRVPPWWLVRHKCCNTVLQHWLCRHMIQSRSRPDLLSLWDLGRPSWAGVAVSDVYRHHCSWLFLPEVQKPGWAC